MLLLIANIILPKSIGRSRNEYCWETTFWLEERLYCTAMQRNTELYTVPPASFVYRKLPQRPPTSVRVSECGCTRRAFCRDKTRRWECMRGSEGNKRVKASFKQNFIACHFVSRIWRLLVIVDRLNYANCRHQIPHLPQASCTAITP